MRKRWPWILVGGLVLALILVVSLPKPDEYEFLRAFHPVETVQRLSESRGERGSVRTFKFPTASQELEEALRPLIVESSTQPQIVGINENFGMFDSKGGTLVMLEDRTPNWLERQWQGVKRWMGSE